MEINVIVAYHSGYGHTEKVAQAVANGASKVTNTKVEMLDVTKITEEWWNKLDNSHAIIFGCPTYMGGVSAQYKSFIDQASKKWMQQKWKDKIAAGFTNSGSYSGDKLNSLVQLVINAMQHGMIWVGNAIMSPQKSGIEGPDSSQINRVGSWLGVATQSNNESPEIMPPIGDLETAKLFGERVATITNQYFSK